MNIKSLPTIAAHAKMHSILAKKCLGQNFIFDKTLCEKIVKSAGPIDSKYILEVGPGTAGLSRAILQANPKKLIAIEMDQRCLSLLEDVKNHYSNLEVIHGDALKIDIANLGAQRLTIIANLPYNIGTELVFRWLDKAEMVDSMTLMLQKEVVERICSKPDIKSYGKLSVMCQVMADVKKAFDVSSKAFYPQPKVSSSIINIKPFRQLPPNEILEKLRLITHFAFINRRKMVKSSLKFIPEEIFSKLGIDNASRAENISPAKYLLLATEMRDIDIKM